MNVGATTPLATTFTSSSYAGTVPKDPVPGAASSAPLPIPRQGDANLQTLETETVFRGVALHKSRY